MDVRGWFCMKDNTIATALEFFVGVDSPGLKQHVYGHSLLPVDFISCTDVFSYSHLFMTFVTGILMTIS